MVAAALPNFDDRLESSSLSVCADRGRCFLVRAGSILWFAEQLARSSSGRHKPSAICFASVYRPARADPTKAIHHRRRLIPRMTFRVDNLRSKDRIHNPTLRRKKRKD